MITKRLFYAIELDDGLRRHLDHEIQRLRQVGVTGRYSRIDNLHVTLQFLGEIEVRQLKLLTTILQQAAAGCKPFSLQFSGLQTFGMRRDILWLDMRCQPDLFRLQRLLTDRLAAAGLPHEARPYQPHLTLVRQARYSDERIWQEKTAVLTQKVTALSLMESTQYQGQLCYLAIARQPLLVDKQETC